MQFVDFMAHSPLQRKYARGWLSRVTIDKS
jgi:hypothetical protein